MGCTTPVSLLVHMTLTRQVSPGLKAARRANGRVVMEDGKKRRLDAVSGATRYNRNLFLNLNKMASILVDEINAGQNVEKIKLK